MHRDREIDQDGGFETGQRGITGRGIDAIVGGYSADIDLGHAAFPQEISQGFAGGLVV